MIGERICHDDFPSDPAQRAQGFRHVLRLLTFATQWVAEFGDPDFPAFLRTTDDAVMFGGPSADNRNLRARVDGNGTYRITGNIGSGYDVLFTASDGDLALGKTGISAERSASGFDIGPDGSVELIVSATEHPGNWLPMGRSTRRIQVRQIFTDWDTQQPGWFDIERIDRSTDYPAELSADRMAEMMGEISRWVGHSTTYWNDYQRDIRRRVSPNTIDAPSAQEGGGIGIRYGFGWWQLEPDRALVVTFAPPPAKYWSIQPYNAGWFEALDYRNRQTTINNAQAEVGGDGLIQVVISSVDPGVANWIDTAGQAEGQLIYRWIWADDATAAAAPATPAPACVVVSLSDLGPGTPVDRAAIVRARRTSVARRHRR